MQVPPMRGLHERSLHTDIAFARLREQEYYLTTEVVIAFGLTKHWLRKLLDRHPELRPRHEGRNGERVLALWTVPELAALAAHLERFGGPQNQQQRLWTPEQQLSRYARAAAERRARQRAHQLELAGHDAAAADARARADALAAGLAAERSTVPVEAHPVWARSARPPRPAADDEAEQQQRRDDDEQHVGEGDSVHAGHDPR